MGLGSYDPELKLVYWSTGNPGHWSPSFRCGEETHEKCNTGKWDNKWSMTIFARKVATGEAVWAYQTSIPALRERRHGVKRNTVIHHISYDADLVPEHQPAYQVQEMLDGKMDLVAIWGPFAGFYKTMKKAPIVLQPINRMEQEVALEFDMALGVRKGDDALKAAIEGALERRKDAIRRVLTV